jgi:heme/copper-type cytochrome/quinol oxidase subunit 1
MATAQHAQETHRDHPAGWRRYLYSTNHKDIGTMYLVFALAAGIIGAALSIGMRMELQQPGLQIFPNSHAYDVFTTAHGLIMIFFMVMRPQTVTFRAMTLPSTRAPSLIRRSEARNSPSIRPKTCA